MPDTLITRPLLTRDDYRSFIEDKLNSSKPFALYNVCGESAKIVAQVFARASKQLDVIAGAHEIRLFAPILSERKAALRLILKGRARHLRDCRPSCEFRLNSRRNARSWPYYLHADGQFFCGTDGEQTGFHVLFGDRGVNDMFSRHFERQWDIAKPLTLFKR